MTATYKPRSDKRRPRFNSDVIRRTDRPLTTPQKVVINRVQRAAFKKAEQCHATDDLEFNFWQRGETIKAVDCRLSQAKNVHFEALMGHFCALAGRMEEAYEWMLKATPEAQRATFIRHKIDELLSTLPKITADELEEETAAYRQGYGDAVCLRMWRCKMDSANASQLDVLYRELKPACTDAATVRRAAMRAMKGGMGA